MYFLQSRERPEEVENPKKRIYQNLVPQMEASGEITKCEPRTTKGQGSPLTRQSKKASGLRSSLYPETKRRKILIKGRIKFWDSGAPL